MHLAEEVQMQKLSQAGLQIMVIPIHMNTLDALSIKNVKVNISYQCGTEMNVNYVMISLLENIMTVHIIYTQDIQIFQTFLTFQTVITQSTSPNIMLS